MMRGAKTRLADAGIEAEITHQLLGAWKSLGVADRSYQTGGDGEIDASDRDQPFDCRIIQRAFRDLLVQHREILVKAIKLAHVPLDRDLFVVGKRLACQPGAPDAAEQIGMGTARGQIGVQDGVNFILDPRPMSEDLVTTCDEPFPGARSDGLGDRTVAPGASTDSALSSPSSAARCDRA